MMRRGCAVHLVHFHSYPFHEATSQEKVREIAKLLARYQLRVRLYQVPFGAAAAAGGRGAFARVAARRHLPAADAADRRSDRARRRRAGAGHRRGASARSRRRRSRTWRSSPRRRRCRSCVRWSGWTRRRSRPRPSASARFPSRSCPTRTAASCSRPGIPRPVRGRRDRGCRADAATRGDGRGPPFATPSWRTTVFPLYNRLFGPTADVAQAGFHAII